MSFIIEVEGISGAGKTTMVPYIQKYLEKQGYSTFSFYEPGFTKLGTDIRKIVLKQENNGETYYKILTKLLLFLTNRVDTRYFCINKIHKSDFTIIDRYYGSTYVYQILSLESEVERTLLRNVLNAAMGAITHSHSYVNKTFVDATILLNVSPNIALKRVKKRDKKKKSDKYKAEISDEFIEFNTKKRKDFLDYFYMLDKNNKNILIDADAKLESVVSEVEHRLEKLLSGIKTRK